jgi:hypothetical protein
MLEKQLRDAWFARERVVPIYPVMTFAPDGLVLGAGTVLLQAEGERQLQSLCGQEARILALLTVAYGRVVAPAVLGNIERAVKSWQDGDQCLAHIHLAHSGLHAPSRLRTAACRLFVAECALNAGVSPHVIFQALKISNSDMDAVEKAYNPAEPRVPAGSGRTSGEWTDGESTGEDDAPSETTAGGASQGSSGLALPASSFLGELNAAQAAELGIYALRALGSVGAAAAAFGLLFIPSANDLHVEGEVPEIPGLRYSWNRDEALLHLNYVDATGQTTNFTAQLEDDVFRDESGNVVARILPCGNIVVDKASVFPDSANDNEPRLCPMPGLDKPGERGRDYEDYVKSVVNPIDTTPRYWGFQLVNPTTGGLVYYDDCGTNYWYDG